MPNHCTNILTIYTNRKRKSFEEIMSKYLVKEDNDYVNLDFNKIIRMPRGILLSSECSSIENITKKRTPEEQAKWDKKIERLHESNMKRYGAKDWYDWSWANWGTKWNSYDGSLGDDGMSFYTAWEPPIPVIAKLSKKINKPLRLAFIDEGWGFVGYFIAYPDGNYEKEVFDNMEEAPQELLDEVGYVNYDEEEELEKNYEETT